MRSGFKSRLHHATTYIFQKKRKEKEKERKEKKDIGQYKP